MPRKRVLTKKLDLAQGLCILIDNGVPCPRRVLYRGLCNTHVGHLRHCGRVEEFALPHEDRKHTFVLAEQVEPAVCRIVDNDLPCDRRSTASGICSHHIRTIRERADLKIEDYLPPGFKLGHSRRAPPRELTYRRQKRPTPGLCVAAERLGSGPWVPCEARSVSRGLCQKHRFRLLKDEDAFDEVANPERRDPAFQVKRRPREGVCVVVEDGEGCDEASSRRRRVCGRHYHALRRAGKLAELTDEFLDKKFELTPKADVSRVAGFCVLIVNGLPCTNPVKRRGLCMSCLWVIGRDGLDLESFALPVTKRREPEFARAERLVPGQCLLAPDGIACSRAALVRGLCKSHYRMLRVRHLLEKFALSLDELRVQPDVPHVYLDKNVVIRFAMHENFGVTPDKSSVALVQAVLARRLRATVSLDCVRAVYSHLGHRLARPTDGGGRGLDEKEAERLARDYTGKLFYRRDGLWNLAPPTDEAFRACAADGRLPHLSLEDALEVHLYASARAKHGTSMFVTADGGILEYGEAVHPERVASTFGFVFCPSAPLR